MNNELIHSEIRTCPECATEDSVNIIIRHYNGFLHISIDCLTCSYNHKLEV